MGLKDPLPRPVAWITRIIGYSVAVVAIGIAWLIAGNLRLGHYYIECMEIRGKRSEANATAMENAQNLVACVDQRAGMVEYLAFRGTKNLFSRLPYAPCEYVGTWEAKREASVYQVTLRADGQFLAEPVRTSDRDATKVTGSWSVAGRRGKERLVWLYDEGRVWPPDINPVREPRADGFTLMEENGSRTEYTRIAASKCDA